RPSKKPLIPGRSMYLRGSAVTVPQARPHCTGVKCRYRERVTRDQPQPVTRHVNPLLWRDTANASAPSTDPTFGGDNAQLLLRPERRKLCRMARDNRGRFRPIPRIGPTGARLAETVRADYFRASWCRPPIACSKVIPTFFAWNSPRAHKRL